MSLQAWGWDDYFQREFARHNAGEPARVINESQGICRVVTETDEMVCRVRRGIQPVTGDWALLNRRNELLDALLDRRTRISRKRAGRETEEQVLAANVDVLFIVTALDGDFSTRRMERYLVAAQEGGAQAVLILNKADQCEDPLARLAEVDVVTRGLTPAVLMSALEDDGVARLHRFVEPGQTAALIGSSGVGKSTIVNRLLGRAVQSVNAVREGDQKGRHTTTGRHLFALPAGWLLMDTPGLREFEPWAGAGSVDAVFEDIIDISQHCRFRDCRHQGEPGCAVAEAVEHGRVDPGRLRNFQTLRNSMTELERKRLWKTIHKAMKKMPDKRNTPD